MLQADLEKARQSFVMTTELHLTYLCVPVTEAINPVWRTLDTFVSQLRVRFLYGLPSAPAWFPPPTLLESQTGG